jgi:hypothetical protein
MTRATGQTLRLVGLAVEMVGVVLWVVYRDDPRKFRGVGLANITLAGVFLGMIILLGAWVVILSAPDRPSAGGKMGPRRDEW